MILGIVGHAQEKFNSITEDYARSCIQQLFYTHEPKLVVSGGCHLGGVDKFAIEEAENIGIPWKEFLPKTLTWSGGYKERNIEIAKASDSVRQVAAWRRCRDRTQFPLQRI